MALGDSIALLLSLAGLGALLAGGSLLSGAGPWALLGRRP